MQEQNTTQAPKLPPRSRLNTPAKTAEIYGVSLRALKRAWADRRLRYYKLGHRTVLLDSRDVEAFLNTCRVDALRT
jgi:hypothetical protein